MRVFQVRTIPTQRGCLLCDLHAALRLSNNVFQVVLPRNDEMICRETFILTTQ